jgi:citrate synthase
MCGVVGALSAFYHGDINIKDPHERETIAIKLIAKMPTIAAYAFRTSIGLPLVQPKKKYSYMQNFLYMMFCNPMEDDFVIDNRIIKV